MVGLGDLPGGAFESRSYDASVDGSVIVGYGNSSSGEQAFIWDQINGMRNVQSVLIDDYDLDLAGWMLHGATGISPDGLTIVGYGTNPFGQREGWIATIPNPVPVPGAALLGILGLSITGWLRRKGAL